MHLTPGNTTDYGYVEEHILLLWERFRFSEMPFDPSQAMGIATSLGAHGINAFKFVQRHSHYNEPTRAFIDLVVSGRFVHGNNPLLDFARQGFSTHRNRQGLVMPVKATKHARIDGLVAFIMALYRWLVNPVSEPGVG
jgi:phage terminase large subunit-like protein